MFDELEDMLSEGVLSSVCGWAISLEKVLVNKEKVKAVKSRLRSYFDGRFVSSWAFVALCLKEVCIYTYSTAF